MICQDLPGATGLFPQSWDLRVDLVQEERVLSSLSQGQQVCELLCDQGWAWL